MVQCRRNRVADWPHSSFHHHVRAGLLSFDWAYPRRLAPGVGKAIAQRPCCHMAANAYLSIHQMVIAVG